MTMKKMMRPVMICTVCGVYVYSLYLAGNYCGNRYGAKRCLGMRRLTINLGDWMECDTCDNTGLLIDESYPNCPGCQGTGWLYTRPLPRRYVSI